MPSQPSAPPPETALVEAHHAPVPRPPFVIDVPPTQPIREATPRADGLGSVDPCVRVDDERTFTYRMLRAYTTRREHELSEVLRAHARTAIGARFREVIGSEAPPARDAGVGADPPDAQLATLVALSLGAMRADDDPLALDYAQDVTRVAPRDAIGFVLAAEAAYFTDRALSDAACARAFALAPHEPEIALAVLMRRDGSSDVMGAIDAVDALLDVEPTDELERWRARLAARAHAFAGGLRRSRGPFTVLAHAGTSDATSEHLLDVASSVLSSALEVTGEPPRGEIVLYVYPDAETRRPCTCPREPEPLELVRADLDDPALDARIRDEALSRAVHASTLLTPHVLVRGLVEIARGPESEADRDAYRSLVRGGHWLDDAALRHGLRRDADAHEARLARAQVRGLLEWLIAERGMPAVHELCRGSVAAMRDPVAAVSHVAGTPVEESTFLAFLAARAAME